MPKLVFQDGPEPGRTVELRDGLNTVGRADTNDLIVQDDSISAHHCVVSVQGDRVVVRDLDSTNGTYIDGDPIHEAPLRPGQTLRVGDVTLAWDQDAIIVSVPEIPRPRIEPTLPLPDGTPACVKHAGVAAVWECGHCGRLYCGPCIHRLGRVGGPVHNFCPVCSAECRWIGPARTRANGWLGTIKQAVRSVFRKKR